MVRQYEQQRDRAVGIVLDLWGDENGSDGDEHAVVVEIAVSMAATIVNDLCSRSGSYFNLTIAGDGVNHFSATPSQNVVREVLENLAVVHPGSGSSLVDSFDWLSHEGKQGMTVVIVSTRSRSQALEQLETMTGESQIATQQGWSLQDALWIDCQNAEDVRGYFQPFDVDLTEAAETKRRSAEVQMTEARAAVGEAI